jgi:sec-independent protein translocase protein TatA
MFLFIGGSELVVVVIVVIMVFGADKIPEIARGLGKGIRQVKDATNDVKREITKSAKDNGIDTEFVKDIKETVSDVKKSVATNVDEIIGPIKRKR